jgi:dTDP-4-dehydrorhamnose reductase
MRVLVTGAGGILGRALQAELPGAGFTTIALAHAELDITSASQTQLALDRHKPDIVINCAAYTRVDDAEMHEAEAAKINTQAAHRLAMHCDERGIRLVYPSTDYVFAGDVDRDYTPADTPRPVNAYGRTKLGGEAGTQQARDYLIVRTSWLFGNGGPNFVRTVRARLEQGEALRVVDDQTGRPTYARDLAWAIGRLLAAGGEPGIYHVTNGGVATWFDFAREIAFLSDAPGAITPCSTAEFPRPAQRPARSVLETSRTDKLIGALRPWRAALREALSKGDY